MGALSTLLERLSATKLAKRLGVKPSTIARWIRNGVSERYAPIVDLAFRRHESARKGRRTYVERRIPIPTKRKPGDPAGLDITPRSLPPRSQPKLESIDSKRYIGEREFFPLEKPAAEVTVGEVYDLALAQLERSRRDFVWVKFYFVRYIPFNRLYDGPMTAKQGIWEPIFVTTHVVAEAGIGRLGAQDLLENAIGIWVEKAHAWAETRVIWCAGFEVWTADDNSADVSF